MTVPSTTSTDDPSPAATALRAWAPLLISGAVACAIFGIAFWEEIAGAVQVWTESTAYNHCFLVVPLVVVMLWNRRAVITALRPAPMPWAVALVLPLTALWAFAALLDILEAKQLILVALFQMLLFTTLGWKGFRALLAPLLFLFFLVPFGAFLVPSLQRFTADFVVIGLHLLGIPIFVNGFTIDIPEGTFEIAEACAGLRFLIASIVFGCFFATVIYQSAFRRLVFIGLSILLPIGANGVRALGIVVLAHIEGSASAVVADHVIYGWIFFSLVTFLLIVIGLSFSESHHSPPTVPAVACPSSGWRIASTMAAGTVLALLGPACLVLADWNHTAPLAAELPNSPGPAGWIDEPNAVSDWRPNVIGAQKEAQRVYRNQAATVTEFIGLYHLRARSNTLTKTVNSIADNKTWHLSQQSKRQISIGDESLTVNSAEVSHGAQRRMIWWFYLVDNHVVASVLEAKLIQARAVLLGHSRLGAFIAISIEFSDTSLPAAEALASFLRARSPTWGIRPF